MCAKTPTEPRRDPKRPQQRYSCWVHARVAQADRCQIRPVLCGGRLQGLWEVGPGQRERAGRERRRKPARGLEAFSLYGFQCAQHIGHTKDLRIGHSAHLRRRVLSLGGWSGGMRRVRRPLRSHSRSRRIRRGAASTLLGPYPAIGPSHALHGLPGSAPHTEVGRRSAVGPSQYPDSRVDSIQAVSRGELLHISFPSPQGARTHSSSPMGRGKRRGGIPAPASVRGAAYRVGR